jgi:LIM domain-containing protein 2
LTGQRYILHDDRPYCKTCYEKLFANTCERCKDKITCDYRDLSYRDRHWHDKCFLCSTCGAGLAEAPFAYKNDRLHCATCYENNFAPRCTLCGAIFRAGMKKYEHRGRQWHAECFCCRVCSKQIGTSSFIPRGDEVVCVPCYEKQYGQQCAKCNGAITKSGVMYSGRPWHRECFQCTHCRTPIGRDKFTTVKSAPYCVLCYGFLFAKKCYACAKPITGVEDAQFIAFDSRQWHAACFRCVRCATPLVGRGFLTDDDDVMCPDCCRED